MAALLFRFRPDWFEHELVREQKLSIASVVGWLGWPPAGDAKGSTLHLARDASVYPAMIYKLRTGGRRAPCEELVLSFLRGGKAGWDAAKREQ